MTAQIPEQLLVDGRTNAMCTEPLDDYFRLSGKETRFLADCSALWRGYIGHWEISGGRLYLVRLNAMLEDGSEASLATVFPGYPDRVFAHWYSGTLRLPQGQELEYVHAGYESTFERDLLIDIERGLVTDTRMQQNGIADDADTPIEGYRVCAMTVFPPDRGADGDTR